MRIMTILGVLALGAGLAVAACDSAKKNPAPVAVEGGAQAAKKADGTAKKADDTEKKAVAKAGEPTKKAGAVDYAAEEHCPFHDDDGTAKAGHEHGEGCDHDAPAKGGAPAPAPEKIAEGARHFGEAFTLSSAVPLAKAIEAHGAGSTDALQISGNIHKVCAKKGCWMVVKDGEAEARVVMKGYSFTVPIDSQGKTTVVEGTLKVKTFTEAQAKHLAEDAGEDSSKVTGERKEFLVTASGITIKG